MRGTPIIISTPKTITRGFYVTKGDIEMTTIMNPTKEILMENTDSNVTNNGTILSKKINEEDNNILTTDLSKDNSITSRTTFADSNDQYSEYSNVLTKLEQTTPLIMIENINQEVKQNDQNLFVVKNVLSTPRRRKIEYNDVTTPFYKSRTNLIADTTTELNRNTETKIVPMDYTVSNESGNTEFDITIPETITPMINTLNTPMIANDNDREENIIELENVSINSSTKLTSDRSEIDPVVSDKSIVISDHGLETTTTKFDLTTPYSVGTFETTTAREEIDVTNWNNVETTTIIKENENVITDTTIQERLTNVEDKIVSKSDRNVQQTKILSTSTIVPSSILLPSQTPTTIPSNQEKNINRRRQRQRIIVLNNQYGQRKRQNLNRRVIQVEDQSDNPKRVLVYRKRQRRPINNNSFTTVASNSVTINDVGSKMIDNKTRRSKLVIKRLKINRKEHKEEEKEEEEEESVPLEKTNTLRDSLMVTEYTERPVDEGGTVSGSSSNRTPGSILANRIRKPNPSSLSSILSTNKRPTVLLGDNRKSRPSETTLSPTTTIVELFDDATVKPEQFVIKEEDERAEISDQNGRAQELAVTLADPPTLQSSSSTGRVPLKDTLRRRISTTVAPRTDFPRTSSTSLRFSTVPKTRQKTTKTTMTTTTTTTTTNKRKEGTTRSSTIRPRRPQIIDYDYYEDEDTPIIEKTMYNGKLFLTNSGTIRCLDQGNFPHPISCKKFITCAKMVNGLIIGAEYTCPHKLSFDPVGGICNWSAGLGCKE
ncbi:PREDICTED: uncharacterized protein LOC106793003 [Polistes canadensis]|uniref:uncharacterized protein LOC106793003 n=1 Tax=Polistes canadensis TaxID=91411 RepID=UPI000718B8DD|nr:PREDICTED: uncharacterized protein LOC106793003 [Polistes canadensis]